MLEEIENFFSTKQKELNKIMEYRDSKEKMFVLEYQEKEIYIFIEKMPDGDSIKLTVVEFFFENKEKGSAQNSRFYTATRKFSEFKQESIFSVYHSIDEIMKILYELISNGKFIIYEESLDSGILPNNQSSFNINKENYIYINELNNNKIQNKNQQSLAEKIESPTRDARNFKDFYKENKVENATEREMRNFSPIRNANNTNNQINFNNNQGKINNNLKIFFRLALLNRILISNIELEYKETSISKFFETNSGGLNSPNNFSKNFTVPTFINNNNNNNNNNNSNKKEFIPNDNFNNIQVNNCYFLTYVMNIIKLLRNKTFEKNAYIRKGFDTKDKFSTIRLDSEGEEIERITHKRNESISINTHTENGSVIFSPTKGLLNTKNNKVKGSMQNFNENDNKHRDAFRNSNAVDMNIVSPDKGQNNTNEIFNMMMQRNTNGGNNQFDSAEFSNLSVNDKLEYYKEKATYLNNLLKYSLKWNNFCSTDQDVAKYSQLHLILDLINNINSTCQKFVSDTEKNFILYDLDSKKRGNIFYKNGTIYDGEIHNGKEHGIGVYYRFEIKKIYEGEFKEGKLYGRGSFHSKSGIVHEGNFQDGFHVFKLIKSLSSNNPILTNQMNLLGSINLNSPKNAEVKKLYECEYKINRFTLHGTMTAVNNSTYIGYFDDENRLNGKGHKKWENGDSYEGDFKEDMRHGYGILKFGNGDIFQGEFKENYKNGKGTFMWANGNTYEGMWKEGKPHGFGKKFWKNGNKFEGFWKEGKQHGKGIKIWSNGDLYDGEYKEGKQHGKGTYTWSDGDKYEGEWKSGLQHGNGCYSWVNGKKYIGEYKEDLKHGKGSLILGAGERYDGEFKENLMHGKGVYIYKDGFKYDGDFDNNMEHGSGILYDEKGNVVYKGLFEYGKRKVAAKEEEEENDQIPKKGFDLNEEDKEKAEKQEENNLDKIGENKEEFEGLLNEIDNSNVKNQEEFKVETNN